MAKKAGKRSGATKRAKPTKAKSTPAKRKKSGGSPSAKPKRGTSTLATGFNSQGRKRGSSKPLTAAQKAAVTRKANAAKKAAARAKKSERQRQRRAEQREANRIAHEEANRERDERDEAIGWLEHMTPGGWSLDFTEAEIAADRRGPWLVVGKFQPIGNTLYRDLWEVVRDWRDDLVLDSAINPNRIACIRIVYEDPSDKRGSGDSVVSHFGVWDLVVSDMTKELDPNDDDSLAARYADTRVRTVYVYFASTVARSAHWYPHYQRD
jgi:hypothetical protein